MLVIQKILVLIIVLFCITSNSQEDYKKTAQSLLHKASQNTYKNKDSTYFYANKLVKLAETQKKWNDYVEARFKINDAALYAYDFTIVEHNLELLDSTFLVQKKYIDSQPNSLTYYNYLNYYKGVYHYILNDYETSIPFFNKILENTLKVDRGLLTEDNKFEISVAYSRIGKMYANEEKYDIAKEIYNKCIRFLNNHYKENKDLLYSIYNLLAEVLKKERDYKASNDYFLETFYFHNNLNSKNSIVTSAFNISENYLNLSKIDSANFFLNVARYNLEKNHKYNTKYHEIKSKILSRSGSYDMAQKELDSALYYLKMTISDRKHPKFATLYNKMGELSLEYGNPEKALLKLKLAEDQFPEDSLLSTINSTTLFKILKNKVVALNRLEKNELSLKVSERATNILDAIKPSFKTTNDRLFLSEFTFPFFENTIESAYDQFLKTNNPDLIDKAFLYSEKSKNSLLMEAILSIKANHFSKIPDSILLKEKKLKARITLLEKKIKNNPKTELKEELYDTNESYLSLIHFLESNHKNYYNLKYNTQVSSIADVQDFLKSDDALISYFFGSNNIFVIKITKHNKEIEQFKIDEYTNTLIKNCYDLLSNPNSDLKILNSKSFKLYTKIVEPILSSSKEKNLIIIADGLLNYIPFGSLCTNQKETSYLIENHNISYISSATLLLELQTKKQNNNKILAFAPEFNSSYAQNTTLLPLPNNVKEVKNIHNYFKGNSYINSEATLDRFNKTNTAYSILHLATHATYDDTNPEFSYLAFTPNKKNEYLLYAKDLYNLELHCDLVTLSACESGIGQLKKGVGMLSLARGFYFSGAASLSSTLWKVNDASTVTIMDDFYLNLSKGTSKNEALRKAKINFITTNRENSLSHPYYWSGFVVSGNTNPVKSSKTWLYIGLSLSIMILLLIMILFRKKL